VISKTGLRRMAGLKNGASALALERLFARIALMAQA